METNQILETAKYVAHNSDFIKINKSKIEDFIDTFEKHKEHYWLLDSPFDINSLNEEEKLMFMVVFNAISFSYWKVTYKGKTYNRGSWSLVASIFRAKEEGKEILNPKYFSQINKEELGIILRGEYRDSITRRKG